jgi:hypothetical protein
MLMGVTFSAASGATTNSRRKVALTNPNPQNEIIRKKPVKTYYQQSLSTARYAAAGSSTGTVSTMTLPVAASADKGPNFLSMVAEFAYSSNAHDIGADKSETNAGLDLYVNLNLSSQFSFLLETGGSKNLTSPEGEAAHGSTMNNTLLGAQISTYKDATWNTFLRAYYIAPTSLASREKATMTGAYKVDATIMPTLYTGDTMKIVYRLRPAFTHSYFDELINRGNDLPNLENQYELRNRLSFIFWEKLALKLHYNFTTYENTLGTRVDDKYQWVQEVEYSVNDNFYVGIGHVVGGSFYRETGTRDAFSLYSSKASVFSGWFGIQF